LRFLENKAAAFPVQCALDEIHWGTAQKAGDEEVLWLVVDSQRVIHLLDYTILHHDDARAHRHSFDLIMGYVNHRCLEALVEFRDLRAHLDAHFGVEIRERLVEEKDFRVPHDGAPDRHALALPAGKGLWPAIKQLFDPQDARGFDHALSDLRLWVFTQLQAECHVVIYAHVRVERVVLKDHRDVTVLRRQIVDALIANQNITFRDFLETGDHSQGCGLSAAGRTDENHELPVQNLETEVLHSRDFLASISGVDFINVFEGYIGHSSFSV
jgi:hypothetical protein